MEWCDQIPAFSIDPSDPCDDIIREQPLIPVQPTLSTYVRPSGASITAGGRAQAITYDGLEEDAIAGGARGAFSPTFSTFSSAASSSSSSRDSAAKKRQRDEKDAARAEKDAAKAAAKEAAKEAAREAAAKEAAAKEAAAKEAAKDSTK